jgi:hypothetical protein
MDEDFLKKMFGAAFCPTIPNDFQQIFQEMDEIMKQFSQGNFGFIEGNICLVFLSLFFI